VKLNATHELKRSTAQAISWTFVRFGGDQLFNFIIYAVLARILAPRDFGVFIISLLFVEIGKTISQGGLTNAFYREPVVTDELADTIFLSNTVLGLVVAVAGYALAGCFSRLAGSPDSASYIKVIVFVIPISAIGASHMARNLREFGHKSLAIRSLLSGLVGGSLALYAAYAGFGAWALVIQRFVAEIINTLVAWRSFRWVPGVKFSWIQLKTQLGFGSAVAGSQLLALMLVRSQDLIISSFLGVSVVGIYRTAWKTIDIISQGVIVPFSTVALPMLSKLQHDMPAFRRAYITILSTSALVAFPCIVGVGALAPDLIPLVYGRQWHDAVPIAQSLSFLVLPFLLNFFTDPALAVLKRSSVIARLAAFQVVLTLVACLSAVHFGAVWVAIAYVIRAYISMFIQGYFFRKETSIRFRDVVLAVTPQLLASIAMAVVMILVTNRYNILFGDRLEPHRIAAVSVTTLAGMLSYCFFLYLFLGSTRRKNIIHSLRPLLERVKYRDDYQSGLIHD
jgi:O-antigen/teichoic acid export membrane protein